METENDVTDNNLVYLWNICISYDTTKSHYEHNFYKIFLKNKKTNSIEKFKLSTLSNLLLFCFISMEEV